MKTARRARRPAVATYGLTHVALAVRDPARTLRFYRAVFGVVEVFRSPGFIQAQTPGSRDVLVFEKDAKRAGRSGGVAHFGFRVTRPAEVAKAARRGAPRDRGVRASVAATKRSLRPHRLGRRARDRRLELDA